MAKLRILHVVNIAFVLPYYIGEQFGYFKKKNVEQSIACTKSDFLFAFGEKQDLPVYPINILRNFSPMTDFSSVCKLINLIFKNRFDIVIGHTPKGGLLSMMASYVCGVKKRIYFRHGLMYETSSGIKKNILILIEKLTGALATHVVCVSPSVLEISNKLKLSNSNKNIILNNGTCNGINVQKFSRNAVSSDLVQELLDKYNITYKNKVIGYVGRLVKDKGLNELLEAWKIIIEERSDLKLLLVGPFEERDSISDELKYFISIESSIIHVGLINDVTPFYCCMDIFILPSYREGFPTVVLEASAMELPVLTSRATGCIDSIIENETGLFINFDALDIKNKILAYIDDPKLSMSHGKNGRKMVVNNFDQNVIWREIEEKILDI